jgi:hypothetical protein
LLKFLSAAPLATDMDRETAQRIVSAAHHAAQAIVRARPDVPVPRQDQLYNRVYLSLLEDYLGHGNVAELLAALARP